MYLVLKFGVKCVMKKAFIITIFVLIGAIFIAGFGFVIWLMDGIAGDPPRQEEYTQNIPVKYKLYPNDQIHLNSEILDDYVSIDEMTFGGKSFLEMNENWYDFDDGTYCLYNKYYVNNNECLEEKDTDVAYRYYFGSYDQGPELIFEVSSDYSNKQWLVKKQYQFPEVRSNTVKNVLFIPMEHENYMNSTSSDNIQRLNETAAIYVEDETLKEKIINDYFAEKFEYDYISSYGIVDTAAKYLILVEFENSVVYQCIGEI